MAAGGTTAGSLWALVSWVLMRTAQIKPDEQSSTFASWQKVKGRHVSRMFPSSGVMRALTAIVKGRPSVTSAPGDVTREIRRKRVSAPRARQVVTGLCTVVWSPMSRLAVDYGSALHVAPLSKVAASVNGLISVTAGSWLAVHAFTPVSVSAGTGVVLAMPGTMLVAPAAGVVIAPFNSVVVAPAAGLVLAPGSAVAAPFAGVVWAPKSPAVWASRAGKVFDDEESRCASSAEFRRKISVALERFREERERDEELS